MAKLCNQEGQAVAIYVLVAAFFYILGVMTAVLLVMYFPEEIGVTSGQMVIADGEGNETPITGVVEHPGLARA